MSFHYTMTALCFIKGLCYKFIIMKRSKIDYFWPTDNEDAAEDQNKPEDYEAEEDMVGK